MHEVEATVIEEMALRALDELPEELRSRIDNLAIVVEEVASARDYSDARVRAGALLGLYSGVPLTRRGHGYGMMLPDRIRIFQGPLQALARDETHLYELVRRTVRHEIAHHFGISDARLRDLGAY